MKRLTTLLALGIALFPAPRAQQISPEARAAARAAAEAEEHGQELVLLERETANALRLSNPTFFRRVYSDDLLGTGAYGQVVDKTAILATVQFPEIKYSSFFVSDIRVRIYHATAVVVSLWTVRGTKEGRPFSRQSRITHVYVYGQRGWKVVSTHETILPG